LVLGAALLLGAGSFAATAGSGIDVYSGGIDMHGTSISNLADPSSAQDAATRGWVNTNDDYEADTNTDASTTCSGADYLAGDGSCNADSYEADTDTSASTECTGDDFLEGSGSCIDQDTVDTDTNTQLDDELANSDVKINSWDITGASRVGANAFYLDNVGNDYGLKKYGFSGTGSSDDTIVRSGDAVVLYAASSGNSCTLHNDGEWTCIGTKNWVEYLNSTYKAVYTSQESPQVRAVYEGNATVTNGQVNVTLPSHFEKTVSDSKPMLRVQTTAHSPVAVGVTARSDSWLVIETAGLETVDVDYRITGIRKGYEDKDVVRKRSDSTR